MILRSDIRQKIFVLIHGSRLQTNQSAKQKVWLLDIPTCSMKNRFWFNLSRKDSKETRLSDTSMQTSTIMKRLVIIWFWRSSKRKAKSTRENISAEKTFWAIKTIRVRNIDHLNHQETLMIPNMPRRNSTWKWNSNIFQSSKWIRSKKGNSLKSKRIFSKSRTTSSKHNWRKSNNREKSLSRHHHKAKGETRENQNQLRDQESDQIESMNMDMMPSIRHKRISNNQRLAQSNTGLWKESKTRISKGSQSTRITARIKGNRGNQTKYKIWIPLNKYFQAKTTCLFQKSTSTWLACIHQMNIQCWLRIPWKQANCMRLSHTIHSPEISLRIIISRKETAQAMKFNSRIKMSTRWNSTTTQSCKQKWLWWMDIKASITASIQATIWAPFTTTLKIISTLLDPNPWSRNNQVSVCNHQMELPIRISWLWQRMSNSWKIHTAHQDSKAKSKARILWIWTSRGQTFLLIWQNNRLRQTRARNKRESKIITCMLNNKSIIISLWMMRTNKIFNP